MYQKSNIFSEGDLVYLLLFQSLSLHTGPTYFQQDYVGLLVFDTVLDFTYFKMRDLENIVLLDRAYINRLKLVLVCTPSNTVNTQSQLTKAIQGTNTPINIEYTAYNSKPIC